jgi:DNA-binding PadR family transcriptional regulator
MRQVAPRDKQAEAKPLTEPVLLILMSLCDQPRHGYALLQDIEQMSGGRVVLSTGTLYGALRRLLEDRWIERAPQDDHSRDKQTYRLTTEGQRQLTAEVRRLRQLTQLATSRMKGMEA